MPASIKIGGMRESFKSNWRKRVVIDPPRGKRVVESYPAIFTDKEKAGNRENPEWTSGKIQVFTQPSIYVVDLLPDGISYRAIPTFSSDN
jgi:hypothetical protein